MLQLCKVKTGDKHIETKHKRTLLTKHGIITTSLGDNKAFSGISLRLN